MFSLLLQHVHLMTFFFLHQNHNVGGKLNPVCMCLLYLFILCVKQCSLCFIF